MSRPPRKILLLPSAFYPSLGGVEEICRNLAAQLSKRGFEVKIATNRHPLDLPDYERLWGVDVHRFDFYYPNRSPDQLLKLPRCINGLLSFARFIRGWRPEIVHIVCPSSAALYCFVVRSLLDFRLLVTFQGELFMDAHQTYARSQLLRFGLRKLLGVADGVTACSRFVLDDARKKYTVDHPIQEIVYNGVDLRETKSSSDTPVSDKRFILSVGRLVPNKGMGVLIDAFAMVSDEYPDLKLVIVGDGESVPALKAQIEKSGLAERVSLAGRKGREEVASYFSACLFFVMPSPVEPFGIVCLEAMRAGKPVIATNTGGPPEFLSAGQDSLLVAPDDATSLAQALDTLLKDPKQRASMGERAGQNVQKFDWSKITEQYTTIYERLSAAVSPSALDTNH